MSAELQIRARELYVPGVVGYQRVGKMLGLDRTTVRRWVNPEAAEKDRQYSREAKRRRTGICKDCGGQTPYHGKRGKTVSDLCRACSLERDLASKVWTREAIIEAIHRWAREHGRPPSVTEWVNSGEYHPARSS